MEEYNEADLPQEERDAFIKWVAQLREASTTMAEYHTSAAQTAELHALGMTRMENFRGLEYIDGIMVNSSGWYQLLTPHDRGRLHQVLSFF